MRCGRALPSGAIVETASDGLIGILTSADRDGKGDAAGFVEASEGKIETPFTIERMTGEGTCDCLFSGSIATALLYSWTMISLQARAFPYLQSCLEKIASGRIKAMNEAPVEVSKSAGGNVFSYAMRTAGRSFGKAVRRASGKEFRWQIAFAERNWSGLDFSKAKILRNPKGVFLADPFTISVDGVDYLFVEEFPFDTRKGVISAYRFENGEPKRIGVVLEEPFHLSFPFVFEHNGEIYMVPEAGGGRSVTLYRATSFPSVWVKEKVLLENVPAVDTIIFQHDELWWMLTTIQGEGPALNNAELYAFYATDLLGEWKPHMANPIVMNAKKGRNGGFLRDPAGRPCRVAQVPGFTFYGAGSAIYRIDELTAESYRETLVQTVDPTFFPEIDGTHHLHSSGRMTVFDFLRVERPAKRDSERFGSRLQKRLRHPQKRVQASVEMGLNLDVC